MPILPSSIFCHYNFQSGDKEQYDLQGGGSLISEYFHHRHQILFCHCQLCPGVVAGVHAVSDVHHVAGIPTIASVPATGVPVLAVFPAFAGVSAVAGVPADSSVPAVAGVSAVADNSAARGVSPVARFIGLLEVDNGMTEKYLDRHCH